MTPIQLLLDVFNPNTSYDFSNWISVSTIKVLAMDLWEKIQDGLTLSDIEDVLFFMLFVRFFVLAFRYNLKTSFYITSIGLFAGYLWYRHLIDLISLYRNVLLELPFLNNLGTDALEIRAIHRQIVLTDIKAGENVRWSDPGKVLYYAFAKGFIDKDPESGVTHYIDPISMLVSVLDESTKKEILPYYYRLYHELLPKMFDEISQFWGQLSGIAAYTVSTRIGKKYCPYLIRWHWTFLLIIGFLEQIGIYLIFRMYYFQATVLIPKLKLLKVLENSTEYNLIQNQIGILNVIICFFAVIHIVFVLFGMFHAIWGQYFYFPFFVENTELHIGPRQKSSVYSGGYTSWQDRREKQMSFRRRFGKLWYGWFGRGTQYTWDFYSPFILLLLLIMSGIILVT